MSFAITSQYPIFTDSNGEPLENGYIYIGTVNVDPITNPILVYWDEALEIPAKQPIRTLAGNPNRNGSPANLYCDVDFSIIVKDKNDNTVYEFDNGRQNAIVQNFSNLKNYVPNGRFELNTVISLTKIGRWFIDKTAKYGVSLNRRTYTDVDDLNNLDFLYCLTCSFSGQPTAAESDYARLCCVIEDVTKLSGNTVTLSWYDSNQPFALSGGAFYKYAVSLTQKIPNSADIIGLGSKIFHAGTGFQRKSITVDLPYIDLSLNDGSTSEQETVFESGIVLNFWLTAGTDFDYQTSYLGNRKASTIYYLNIADVRLNKGSTIIEDNDVSLQEDIDDAKRYHERSATTISANQPGCVTFVAGSASTTIPGFRFQVEKRTTSPTVNVYSYATATVDNVTYVGVGNIAVSSYNDITSSGVGSMTLASPTVAGGVYKYHWIVDDEFTL
jgi:hypothetical protein